MKGVDELARAVARVFAKQRKLADRGRERFGDFVWELAKAMQGPLETLYLSAARGAKARAEHADDFAAMARERAVEAAREINATTGDWVIEGRENVFGSTRVAMIATTEATTASSRGRAVVAAWEGRRVKWKASRNACKHCRALNGRVRKPGASFGVVNGKRVLHPAVHPGCLCSTEVV